MFTTIGTSRHISRGGKQRLAQWVIGWSALLVMGVGLAAADPVSPLPVVASFSILGDMVRVVGGDRVTVTTLVGPDSSVHAYAPTPRDIQNVAQARLLVVNGLGFEGWMERLVQASGFKGHLVTGSAGIKPLDHDPHAWQDLNNGMIYAANISRALADVDPQHATHYQRAGEAYMATMSRLDAEIRQRLAALSPQRRKVITSHDAFGYFAVAYGVTFLSPLGGGSEGEVTATNLARMIRQVRHEGVKALFVENISDPRLAQRIAQETGAKIGGKLYSDALSAADGPAATYLELFRHNVGTLLAAM
ncbi:MAG: metal ABC transporter substrate-binding protein [Magnetococcales bacterium]|nr:metal ABC transporter substrate-binding protein [Magnetococcales bacterium]